MSFKILFIIVVVNVVFNSASLNDEIESERESVGSGNAPFFELPCMAVGGVCARSVACPKGTKVTVKGLCPVQQDLGMECCRTKVTATSGDWTFVLPKKRRCVAPGNETQMHTGTPQPCLSPQFWADTVTQRRSKTYYLLKWVDVKKAMARCSGCTLLTAVKQSTCKLKGGECLSPRDFRCPRSLHVGVVTDCNADQVCCVYV